MPWIRTEDVGKGAVIEVMSILPGAMDAVANMNMAITFGGSTLTRVQEEAISTAVATINRCRY
jgi:alkylhydroperoxidase family enzyme